MSVSLYIPILCVCVCVCVGVDGVWGRDSDWVECGAQGAANLWWLWVLIHKVKCPGQIYHD